MPNPTEKAPLPTLLDAIDALDRASNMLDLLEYAGAGLAATDDAAGHAVIFGANETLASLAEARNLLRRIVPVLGGPAQACEVEA